MIIYVINIKFLDGLNLQLVTVIIVNWNGAHLLQGCLDSLRCQSFQDFSIVVVDNGSDDGSLELLNACYPDVHLMILKKNRGFAKAVNMALNRVHSRYFVLLNNDVELPPDWLVNLVNALESHSEAGSATSKMLEYAHPDIIDRAGDSYTRAGAGFLRGRGMASGQLDTAGWVFGACGGASIYRRAMIDEIGGFDPDFFLIYEDVDLSFRGQLRGYKCFYEPRAVAYHKVSRSIGYDSGVSVYYGHRNLEWVYLKNMPKGLWLKTFAPHLVYNILSLLFFAYKGLAIPYIHAKRDALRARHKMLEKRRLIQATKVVDNDYIWQLMEKERFFPRVSNRFRDKE